MKIHYHFGMCSWPGLDAIKRNDWSMDHFILEAHSGTQNESEQSKKLSLVFNFLNLSF